MKTRLTEMYLEVDEVACKKRDHKPVQLVKPFNFNTEYEILRHLQGTGKFEWEEFLAEEFIKAVNEAKNNNKDVANITEMFSYDFMRVILDVYTMSQECVIDFLFERLFDIVSETEELLTVKIKDTLLTI